MGTRADWQGQLRLAVAELGLQGLRMHGVLDDDMSVVNDKGMYSWYNIDRVYDFMLSLNVRPVVELSFMPKYLANCSDCPSKDGNPRQCFYAFGDPGSYKGLTQPPQDFADWYDLIHALATHLTERHGLAEVSQWHFEVHPSTAHCMSGTNSSIGPRLFGALTLFVPRLKFTTADLCESLAVGRCGTRCG